jgi:hypothetical protein
MISADQARKNLNATLQADQEARNRKEAEYKDAENKEIARALKEDVPLYLADIEKSIHEALARREGGVTFRVQSSVAVRRCFDVVIVILKQLGYDVIKEYERGVTADTRDILNITWMK